MYWRCQLFLHETIISVLDWRVKLTSKEWKVGNSPFFSFQFNCFEVCLLIVSTELVSQSWVVLLLPTVEWMLSLHKVVPQNLQTQSRLKGFFSMANANKTNLNAGCGDWNLVK